VVRQNRAHQLPVGGFLREYRGRVQVPVHTVRPEIDQHLVEVASRLPVIRRRRHQRLDLRFRILQEGGEAHLRDAGKRRPVGVRQALPRLQPGARLVDDLLPIAAIGLQRSII